MSWWPPGWHRGRRGHRARRRGVEPGDGARRPESAASAGEGARRLRSIRAYHELTKHQLQRYARGPADLDWESQPDPFLRFPGAALAALDPRALEVDAAAPNWDALWAAEPPAARALERASLSRLLLDSLALSAWKSAGEPPNEARWALRANPSSGNLHPTEATLVLPAIEGLGPGPVVAHYAPREHALELRVEAPRELFAALRLQRGEFLVGLSSIPWREAWKYGERAYRYCQHDLGHALAALACAARALGWRAERVDGCSTADLQALLGLDPTGPEGEHAETLVLVSTDAGAAADPRALAAAVAGSAASWKVLPWRMERSRLSPAHVEWDAVDAAFEAAAKPAGAGLGQERGAPHLAALAAARAGSPRFSTLARARRSAVAFDKKSGLARTDFERLLARALARRGGPLDGVRSAAVRVHLALFVHRVVGLDAGIYLATEADADLGALRAAMRPEFRWEAAVEAQAGLALCRLHPCDARSVAAHVSCQQDIAADGAFAAGMLVEFDALLERHGAWAYPRLYWNCGMVGQVLYLEAEALGLRGTGIGCYFDDALHGLLGLRGTRWQSLYHFAIGAPVADARLRSWPAYPPPP